MVHPVDFPHRRRCGYLHGRRQSAALPFRTDDPIRGRPFRRYGLSRDEYGGSAVFFFLDRASAIRCHGTYANQTSRRCYGSIVRRRRWAETGQTYAWPTGDSLSLAQLDRLRPPSTKDSRKYYVDGAVKTGWCELGESDNGEYLAMRWSPEQLPYFGVWINEGRYNGQRMIAPEPCNGFYDILTEAVSRNKRLILAPGHTEQWTLNVSVGRS